MSLDLPTSDCSILADTDLAVMLEALAALARRPMPVAGAPQPVVGWQGGKRWLVKELVPLLPPHKMYVELFCGGASFSSKEGRLALLRAFNRRLDKVVVENLDWQECVSYYDSKTTVFFCDPPYTTGEAAYGAWSIDDLARFREEGLDQMRGTWILTIDDTPANRALFRDCLITVVGRKNGIAHRADGTTSLYHELIIRPNDGRHQPTELNLG